MFLVCGCRSPLSGQAADPVAMDSFYTKLQSVMSPQTPDERVLLVGDFDAMVGSVRSAAIGGGLGPSPRMAVVFVNFWT